MKNALAAFAVCLASSPANAQVDQVVTPPPNLVLANYNSVPVGPFGGLEGTAYVARVGDPSAAWFNPAGLAKQDAPQISGSAGPSVTAGGLVFVGATSDRRLRAFDAKTGKELWSTRLEAQVNANPMTYRGKSGKQYVAAVATNSLVAFALP